MNALSSASPGTVLIVDDLPDTLHLLSQILTDVGYRVRVATTGAFGLESVRLAPPDVILLDVKLPDLSGFEVCRRLKADPLTASIPVLFLSALHATPDKIEAFAAGGVDYITKPFEAHEVLVRVQCHLARTRAEAALSASRARLQAILDNAPVGIAMLDEAWQPQEINARWADLLGYSPAEAQRWSLLEVTHPADTPERQTQLASLARGEIPRYQRETRLLHSDGGIFWAELLVAPVRTDEEPPTRFVAILTDITERMHSLETMSQHRQALAILQERERLALEMHGTSARFFDALYEQVQHTLDAVRERGATAGLGYLDTLMQWLGQQEADTDEFLLGLHASAQRTEEALQPRGLRDTLGIYVQQFSILSGVPATLQVPPDWDDSLLPPPVALQLLRVVQEALANVRKHAHARQVRLRLQVEEEYLGLHIEDDGCGFEVAHARQSDSPRYGLENMRAHAREINAQLRLTSAPNAGTTVTLVLPLEQPALQPTLTVLLVGTHPLLLDGLQHLLLAHGLEVLGIARTVPDWLTQARTGEPKVVLLDLDEPPDGWEEALGRLRQVSPSTRVVLLTRGEQDPRLRAGLAGGVAGYLLKNRAASEVIHGLQALAQGEVVVTPTLATHLLNDLKLPLAPQSEVAGDARDETPSPLGARQIEVLGLLQRGLTYKEIGDALVISERTVRYHLQEMLQRLHLSNRTELIAYAARLRAPA